jgi:hypothetical protein
MHVSYAGRNEAAATMDFVRNLADEGLDELVDGGAAALGVRGEVFVESLQLVLQLLCRRGLKMGSHSHAR